MVLRLAVGDKNISEYPLRSVASKVTAAQWGPRTNALTSICSEPMASVSRRSADAVGLPLVAVKF